MSARTSRRWPRRNFLAELEPELRDTHAIDDLARRHPTVRRARGKLRAAMRPMKATVRPRVWVELADAVSAVQTAEFELAFNLGVERGLVAGPAESLARRGRRALGMPERRFHAEMHRIVGAAEIPTGRILAALLEFCWALATDGPGLATRAPARARTPR